MEDGPKYKETEHKETGHKETGHKETGSDGPLGTRVSILSLHIQHSLHRNNVSRRVLKTLTVTCQIVSKRFVT